MSEFTVKTGNALATADEQKEIGLRMQNIGAEVLSIRNNLSFKVRAKANINGTLKTAVDKINTQSRSMNHMENGLRSAVSEYLRTEQKVVVNAKSGNLLGKAEAIFGSGNRIGDASKDAIGLLFPSGLTLAEMILLPETIREAITDKIEDVKDYIIDQTGFEAEVSTEGSLYSTGVKGEYGSAGVSVGAYEAYTSAKGGLVTEGENGELLFNPHVDAKAGASICLLTAFATTGIGNEMLGAGASGNITVGKASAEAQLMAQILDEDGNFNPNASFSGDLELVAVEAEGEAGVSILGTEAKVTGSVYVGAGAHLDVGYADGKLKFDVGAAIGIGASAGFEVDIGGTVEAVGGFCESVFSTIFG